MLGAEILLMPGGVSSAGWEVEAEGLDLPPAPRRPGPTWAEFLRSRANGIVTTHFLTVDSVLLRPLLRALRRRGRTARRVPARPPSSPPASSRSSRRSASRPSGPRPLASEPMGSPSAGYSRCGRTFSTMCSSTHAPTSSTVTGPTPPLPPARTNRCLTQLRDDWVCPRFG